jgi:hypothetical protein
MDSTSYHIAIFSALFGVMRRENARPEFSIRASNDRKGIKATDI